MEARRQIREFTLHIPTDSNTTTEEVIERARKEAEKLVGGKDRYWLETPQWRGDRISEETAEKVGGGYDVPMMIVSDVLL